MEKSYVMHYARIRKNGNGTSEHVIVRANDFEEAKEKARAFCERLQDKYPDEQYKPCDTGYEMSVGGGCKW